ncbi:hypothetical protein DM01DRAFT_1223046 [Hesseltinella vesiculosa]|uniref:A-kinase anchor protein 7-like phosphoesterase domain-containing protein n=1 Tax=Hesseltinella vesiculosa TaxID=101127 RepID=A0A1X2GPF3_9FUNG|nr:hypothetical protein DM01DRAFT_1223046 [Hesseltinella vesiculosa]
MRNAYTSVAGPHPYLPGKFIASHSLIFPVASPALQAKHSDLVKLPFFTSLNPEFLIPYDQLHVTLGQLYLPTPAAVQEAQRLLHGHILQFAQENQISHPIPVSLEGLFKSKGSGRSNARLIYTNPVDKSEKQVLVPLHSNQSHARKKNPIRREI